MSQVMILMANGFEEIEALTVVDLLRRADITVDMVSVTGQKNVIGAHDVIVQADFLLEEIESSDYKMIATPGGMPGSTTLKNDARVTKLLRTFFDDPDRYLASICASPLALEAAGIAKHIAGTCYPGIEQQVHFREWREDPVVTDQQVITSRGPATAIPFALKIIEVLKGKKVAFEIEADLLFPLICKQ